MKSKLLIILFLFLVINGVYAESTVDLTEEELQFIEDHPVITLGVDPSFYPFEFIDTDGGYKGLANDYIKLLNKNLGINMQVIFGLTWSEAYEQAVEKSIDVLPCVSQTDDRKQYFLFSNKYYEFQRVVITREKNDNIREYDDLFGLTVGVQKNSSHHSFLMGYPAIKTNLYNTLEEGLEAVSNGSEQYFVGNLAASNTIISQKGFQGLKYFPLKSDDITGLHFAVRNDWPELRSILDKGLKSITKEEKRAIESKWVVLEEDLDLSNYIFYFSIVLSVILLVVLVSFYWILRLRKEIKKRIEIEAALEVAKEEAEVANEVKSSFLARMSHEIRTPLNAITGMSYILSGTDLNNTQRSHLEKIRHASTIMLSIINDILDFSKIEAGKVDLEEVTFNLDTVVSNVLNIVSFKIDEKDLDLTLTRAADLPTWYIGDGKRIEQILLNIINNAVKFTDQGEISIDIQLTSLYKDRYSVTFKVIDTGIGISDKHLRNLFEPFNQEDASISRRFGGTGLGLSIVKNLTDLLGGTIEVKSHLGIGTEFTLSFDLKIDVLKERQMRRGFEYIKNIKALIFDRDKNNLSIIKDYLRSFGISPEFTSSKGQMELLLKTADQQSVKPYDLIIIDYESLMSDGETFIKKMVEDDYLSHIPKVIVLLPFMEDNLQETFIHEVICVTKPVLPSPLYNAIVDMFSQKVVASQMEHQPINSKEHFKTDSKILVVEDNKTNQFIAKSLLEKLGSTVIIANHGQHGVELFKENLDVDLVLMDLHMPVMNGYEASEIIRGLDPSMRIVAMTADAIDGVKEKCFTYGISHFISKPFDPDLFLEYIHDLLTNVEDKNSTSLLDETLGLRMMGGNQGLYEQVKLIFKDENKETLNQLENVVSKMNYEEGIEIAHKVKSSAGSLGAESVRMIASELQIAFEKKNESDIKKLSIRFNEVMSKLLKELN